MILGRTAPRLARIGSVVLLLGTCVLAACGGSGSSGFDGEPAGSEPEAITRAVDEGSCVEFAASTYCGSGASFEVQTGPASVTIDEPLTPVVCTEVPAETECMASLGFTTEGFPAGTNYLVASADSVDGPWSISADMPPPSSGGAPEDKEAEVQLPTSGGSSPPPTPLIVAVLVYLDAPPQEAASESPLLADFAADVVYVSRALDVTAGP